MEIQTHPSVSVNWLQADFGLSPDLIMLKFSPNCLQNNLGSLYKCYKLCAIIVARLGRLDNRFVGKFVNWEIISGRQRPSGRVKSAQFPLKAPRRNRVPKAWDAALSVPAPPPSPGQKAANPNR